MFDFFVNFFDLMFISLASKLTSYLSSLGVFPSLTVKISSLVLVYLGKLFVVLFVTAPGVLSVEVSSVIVTEAISILAGMVFFVFMV